jgi:hypothetical protein
MVRQEAKSDASLSLRDEYLTHSSPLLVMRAGFSLFLVKIPVENMHVSTEAPVHFEFCSAWFSVPFDKCPNLEVNLKNTQAFYML